MEVLFFSGSIGLGHIVRDLAIAEELRRQVPGIQISWLAAHPADLLLKEAGEKVLPEAADVADDSISAESAAKGYKLNLLKYLSNAYGAWKQNVEVFKKVIDKSQFDLIIGDETYEIGIAIQKKEIVMDTPFVIIYDFLGIDAMTRNPVEHLYTYIWNKTWSGVRIFEDKKNMALFVGEIEDIPDKGFGLFMPHRREYARKYYHFVGYIIPYNPEDYADKLAIRKKLGYNDSPLVVCSIGGTNVGKDLLELCGRSYPLLKKQNPDLQLVLVCGPRLNPDSIQVPDGVITRGYVPALYEHFAASDMAVVQGGGTTTLELTALRQPFIYFPLEEHFEQELNVVRRLSRHKAGIRMNYSDTTPEILTDTIIQNLGREGNFETIPVDGAYQAVQKIKSLIDN
jgi:UDP-N-acetylglucosamine:LPS N-acetylglucosamine transferase